MSRPEIFFIDRRVARPLHFSRCREVTLGDLSEGGGVLTYHPRWYDTVTLAVKNLRGVV